MLGNSSFTGVGLTLKSWGMSLAPKLEVTVDEQPFFILFRFLQRFFVRSLLLGATDINGAGETVLVIAGGDNTVGGVGEVQFLNHKSGVMRAPEGAGSFRVPWRWGCNSKWALVSRQKICILYWLRHLSEQN